MTSNIPSGGDVVGCKWARPAKQRHPPVQYVLMNHLNEEKTFSNVTKNLVTNYINQMQAKLALRDMRKICRGFVLIIADSAADIERLVSEANLSELAKDHTISKSWSVQKKITIFGREDASVEVLKAHN